MQAVENSSFWPFKSLMSSYMAQKTISHMEIARMNIFVSMTQAMSTYEQFKRYMPKTSTPSGPLMKRPSSISCYRSKGLAISNIFCSKGDYKFFTVNKKLADPLTPYWEQKKIKARCAWSILLNNFCSVMLFKIFIICKPTCPLIP